MARSYVIYILLLSSVICSCQRYSPEIEHSLRFAGNNRAELESVLEHYAQDSLKYRAACFLIENMPYYYFYKNDKIDLYRKEVYKLAEENNGSGMEAMKILTKKYGPLNPDEYEKVYDAHVITADYLIDNIEWAFKVWEEKPWNKDLSFDDFCETILPYRINTEPLEYWREYYYTTYQPLLDSLLPQQNDPKEAIDVLWEPIHERKQWLYTWKKPHGYPFPGAVTLDTLHRIGDCYEYNNFGIYLMRALGIPGGTDAYLQHPYGGSHHIWNYVPDAEGNLWDFSINGYPPKPGPNREKPLMGSVFRTCFAVQETSLPYITQGRKDLPPLLNTLFKKDVSNLYLHDASITIPVDEKELKDTLLYLCVFNRSEWTPIRWSVWKDGKFVFPTVEKNMLYASAYYKDGELLPLGVGSVNSDGEYIAYTADTQNLQTISVERKYPYKATWFRYRKRIIGGKFQAANNPEFRNAVTFHTIDKETDMRWYDVKFPASVPYRYVRYLSGPDRGHCNMAELEFYDSEGKKLRGKVIGTDGSYQNKEDNRKEAVFDRNPLTYYDALEEKGSWAGLDLGEPKYIAEVRYLFRNDDNNIRLGDLYELFYFGSTGWVSLGTQVAESSILKFEGAPTKALFWLKNHTRGKEELPFFYEDGEQVFWEI
ncbi:MAG: hypothetical protein LIO93_10170 [Bacteroidales bacterium]|nr:hypothetical protein [Bacteroidales bacterium]